MSLNRDSKWPWCTPTGTHSDGPETSGSSAHTWSSGQGPAGAGCGRSLDAQALDAQAGLARVNGGLGRRRKQRWKGGGLRPGGG